MGDQYIVNEHVGDEDSDLIRTVQQGVKMQVKLSQLKGKPVARFDAKTKKAYLEYPDGRKEYRHEQ
jgi:hypothetical protein